MKEKLKFNEKINLFMKTLQVLILIFTIYKKWWVPAIIIGIFTIWDIKNIYKDYKQSEGKE